jgi:hypothetical protein
VKDDVTPHDEQDGQLDDEQLDEMTGGYQNYMDPSGNQVQGDVRYQ